MTATFFIPIERLFALRRQPILRKGFFADLGWLFLNMVLTPILLGLATFALVKALASVVPMKFVLWMEAQPLWFLLPLSLLVGEIGYYWGHRLMHEIPWLWRFHAIHHSPEEMDWLVNSRAHPVDIVFTRLCKMLPLLVFGLSRPMHGYAPWLLLLLTEGSLAWTYLIHANVKWRLKWLERILSTPAFHHWHHSNDGAPYLNKNYSSLFPIVDIIFRTYHLPDRLPEKYGIDQPLPQGIARQFFRPFFRIFNKSFRP